MKTGFSNDSTEFNSNDYQLNIMSLLTVFMENALENASTYTVHSKRNIVTSTDISMALKRELFEFLNCPNIEERAKKILEDYKLELENDEEEYDEEEYDEEENDEEEYDEEEYDEEEYVDNNSKKKNDKETDDIFCKNNCQCEICLGMNTYSEQWNTWKPTNGIEEILYNGINKIDKDYNLI